MLLVFFVVVALILIPLREPSGKRLEKGRQEKDQQHDKEDTKSYVPSFQSLRDNARPIGYVAAALFLVVLAYSLVTAITATTIHIAVPPAPALPTISVPTIPKWPLILLVVALAIALLAFTSWFERLVVAAAILAVAAIAGILPTEKLGVTIPVQWPLILLVAALAIALLAPWALFARLVAATAVVVIAMIMGILPADKLIREFSLWFTSSGGIGGTTAECPGGPIEVTADIYWKNINPGRNCRVVAYVKPGHQVRFRGSDGVTPFIDSNGGHMTDMVYYNVMGRFGGEKVNIGLCPKWTAHIKNVGWDCRPVR